MILLGLKMMLENDITHRAYVKEFGMKTVKEMYNEGLINDNSNLSYITIHHKKSKKY